jgi:CheY-like chemotaxis protein
VVEDSAPNRKLLCALLKRLNCVVESVENGQLCLDAFQPLMQRFPLHSPAGPLSPTVSDLLNRLAPFDIILMDNSMPVLNGMEATSRLRAHGFTLPIVGVTGNVLQEDQQAFRAAGVTEILVRKQPTTCNFCLESFLTTHSRLLFWWFPLLYLRRSR